MRYHVEFDVDAPEKATPAQARDWIKFMCGYSSSLNLRNPLKKASFDPVFGSMKIQAGEARETRRAVMLSAWQYRKVKGLSMSAALKQAWADCKAVKTMADKPNVFYIEDYLIPEGAQYGKAENY